VEKEDEEALLRSLKTDFSALTEPHKKQALELTKFLVLTQEVIVPGMMGKDRRTMFTVQRTGHGREKFLVAKGM
jgi:hypothetical protein